MRDQVPPTIEVYAGDLVRGLIKNAHGCLAKLQAS